MAAAGASVLLVMLLAAVVCVRADMSADRSECAEQLVGLAPCLQYVQGQARSPAPDCCGGLRQVLGTSPKCLCVLVKDKDDPNLGININASLALALPSACGATKANVSHCPELLHLPPNSKDAAIFSPGGDKGPAATPGKDNTTSTTNSRTQQAANGAAAAPSTATGGVALAALLLVGYLALLLPREFPAAASF